MENTDTSAVIYKLNDNPPFMEKIFAALQHLCAIFVPIMTPWYIVCQALIIISVSLGCGLGVAVPGVMDKLPEIKKTSFSSGIATGGEQLPFCLTF